MASANKNRIYCNLPIMLKELLLHIDSNLKNEIITRALFKYFTEETYKELRHSFSSKEELEEFENSIYEIYGDLIQRKTQRQQATENKSNKVSISKKTTPKKTSSIKPKEIPIQDQEIDLDEMYDEFDF